MIFVIVHIYHIFLNITKSVYIYFKIKNLIIIAILFNWTNNDGENNLSAISVRASIFLMMCCGCIKFFALLKE